MKFFGLGEVVVQWIEEHLSGRVSGVHIGTGKLEGHSNAQWCSAGLRDGPTLVYIFFVNDLSCAIDALALLFADDISYRASALWM